MIEIIAALDSKNGIGKEGKLPWSLPLDLKYFKELTLKAPKGKINAVIMGRKTWESLPERLQPLPGRTNVVLTSHNLEESKNLLKASSLEEALEKLEKLKNIDRCFVIGGATLYKEALSREDCLDLYLTRIDADFSCEVFFPEIPEEFKIVRESQPFQDKGFWIYFETQKRKEEPGSVIWALSPEEEKILLELLNREKPLSEIEKRVLEKARSGGFTS